MSQLGYMMLAIGIGLCACIVWRHYLSVFKVRNRTRRTPLGICKDSMTAAAKNHLSDFMNICAHTLPTINIYL
jgi:predicted small secreted protein